MEWLFCVNPNIFIGLVSALACLYFLCICAEETKTLLAYHRAMRPKTEPLARHRRMKFPYVSGDPADCFVSAEARLMPSGF